MNDVVNLNDKRKPITYTITVTHHWDGTIETFVHDVADDERSRSAVGYALRCAAEQYLDRKVRAAADDMLAIMLANIDAAMACTEEKPAVFNIKPTELASWADAVQKYESVRFPEVG